MMATNIPIWEAVLIESDWNLKGYVSNTDIISWKVLIESDWNLKQGSLEDLEANEYSINRIRLEFKAL